MVNESATVCRSDRWLPHNNRPARNEKAFHALNSDARLEDCMAWQSLLIKLEAKKDGLFGKFPPPWCIAIVSERSL